MTDCEQLAPGPANAFARMAPFDADGSLGRVGAVRRATAAAPPTHALLDRLKERLDLRAPADMFKRFADAWSFYD